MEDEFSNAVRIVCSRLKTPLNSLPENIRKNTQEIRLRANMPLCITLGGKNYFVSALGQATNMTDATTVICDKIDVARTFQAACDYSVYAYQNEINQGFVTVAGGDRIGICGTAVVEGDTIKSMKNISSLNIRVAREHKFCASKIIERYKSHGIKNTVIVGSPSSGKTTILRDIAYQLSSGKCVVPQRVCVVDERFEICAVQNGISPFDMGNMCDMLSGAAKSDGIQSALRTLNPQVIIFDEISTNDELKACAQGFSAGSYIITSLHSSGVRDFGKRQVCKMILDSGIFDCFVFLGRQPGEIRRIITKEELQNEIGRDNTNRSDSDVDWFDYGA